MFTNLIDNAVRYTPAGGRVEIRVEPGGDTVAVEICDTGPGLPEDMLGRVFERFTRHTEDGEGTGLGLAIVRAIADRIGGRVSLSNRSGARGLVARVELQAAASPARPRRAAAAAAPLIMQRASVRRPHGDDQEPVGVRRGRRRALLSPQSLRSGPPLRWGSARLGWLHRTQARTEPPEPSVPVVAGRVGRADVPIDLTGIGTVQAFNSVLVKARVDGQIVRIDFAEGQEVHGGDVIAEIDPRPYAAALAQAKAVQLKDKALLENAQLDLGRATGLWPPSNSIARPAA